MGILITRNTSEIEGRIVAQFRFSMMMIILSLISIAITVGIAKYAKRTGFKYIPSIFFALIAIGCIIKSRWFSQGFEDLAYLIMAIMAIILAFIVTITAFFVGIYRRKKHGKNMDPTAPL